MGVILNNIMDFDEQWEVASAKINPQIYLRRLRSMGFTEEKLVCV
jgi:hypothetical protein